MIKGVQKTKKLSSFESILQGTADSLKTDKSRVKTMFRLVSAVFL